MLFAKCIKFMILKVRLVWEYSRPTLRASALSFKSKRPTSFGFNSSINFISRRKDGSLNKAVKIAERDRDTPIRAKRIDYATNKAQNGTGKVYIPGVGCVRTCFTA